MRLFITFGSRPEDAHIDDDPKTMEAIVDIPKGMLVTFWGVEMQPPSYVDPREVCQWTRPDVCGFVNIENCARHGTPRDTPSGRMTILRQPLSMHSSVGQIHTYCGHWDEDYDAEDITTVVHDPDGLTGE
jgi:hypothetical protein